MLRSSSRRLLIGLVSCSCAGVVVPLEVNLATRVAFRLAAALQITITDGKGMAKCLQWNGHGSMRPCFGHINSFLKNVGMVDDTRGFVDITCSRTTRDAENARQPTCNGTLNLCWRRGEITRERLDEIINAAGLAAPRRLADSDCS